MSALSAVVKAKSVLLKYIAHQKITNTTHLYTVNSQCMVV